MAVLNPPTHSLVGASRGPGSPFVVIRSHFPHGSAYRSRDDDSEIVISLINGQLIMGRISRTCDSEEIASCFKRGNEMQGWLPAATTASMSSLSLTTIWKHCNLGIISLLMIEMAFDSMAQIMRVVREHSDTPE